MKMAAKKKAVRENSPKRSSASRPRKKRETTSPRTSQQYFALPASAQETWNRVAHVIAKMRSEGISLAKASREFAIDPRIVRNRAGSALRKTKSGRYAARPSDKLLRIMVIPGSQGQQEIAVRGSSTATSIGEYMGAVQRYLRTGDSSGLKKFRRLKLVDEKGKRVKLVTDLAELKKLGSAGVLSFESLYGGTDR